MAVRISREIELRIMAAPPDLSDQQLAEQLGIHRNTVAKYRRLLRREQREFVRERMRDRIIEAAPSALSALRDALACAHQQMLACGDRAWVAETRACAIAVLQYVGLEPERDPLEGHSDEALLEELSQRLGLVRRG